MVSLLRRRDSRSTVVCPAKEEHEKQPPTTITPAIQSRIHKYLKMPVVLEGTLWKRRNGMGKLRSRRAWRQRRFELRGSVLWYYPVGQDLDEDDDEDDDSSSGEFDWQPATAPVNQPRGFLDLARDKNTRVHASLGNLTGAPSPFCLSIVVNEQTQWKLACEGQCVLMQWLAAMTNVVVRCSVDEYNVRLLQSVSKSVVNHGHSSHNGRDSLFLRRPPVYEPQSTAKFSMSTHHQLWLTEDYTVLSTNASVRMGPQTIALTIEKENQKSKSSSEAEVALLKRQHVQELEDKDKAHQKELLQYQQKVVALTTTNAETSAKHHKTMKGMQQEVLRFAQLAKEWKADDGWESEEEEQEKGWEACVRARRRFEAVLAGLNAYELALIDLV